MPPPPPTPQQPFFTTVLNAANAETNITSSTTNHAASPHRRGPPAPPAAAAASTFTPTQRSLQARNKPFAHAAAGESYDARQRREQAALILGSVEMLMWYSAARNETLPQTRHHFQNIVLGLDGADVSWREEWEVPEQQQQQRGKKDGEEASPARGSVRGKKKV